MAEVAQCHSTLTAKVATALAELERTSAVEQHREVVALSGPASPRLAAPGASMDDDEVAALVAQLDRLHQGATGGCPVAGVHVDVT